MASIQIPDLPTIGVVDGDEQLPLRDTNSDKKVTPNQLVDFVKQNLTPEEILDLVKLAAPNTNGLNANLLQGLTSAFLRNADNINSGVLGDDRLPQGSTESSFSPGGEYTNAGLVKEVIYIPPFLVGGARIMIQYGWTNFIRSNRTTSVTFKRNFVGGYSDENRPFLMVIPECRSNEWPLVRTLPYENVELSIAPFLVSNSGFSCSSFRHSGRNEDTVRGNWFAIGYY